ncbi:MAG: UDP-3-O-[3-hydroxymyristoyl] N-acetylglucosamine deacetylase [Desulfobulbaceae bacterium A2]|nr:MAG: UDP-3-O-[3-hydroxymyristoyl] N-acetylglucosamine deacetylase [Desulfobulbaceae bacterium A2]
MTTHQHTLRKKVRCKGTGLHSGKPVHLTIKPAAPNTGFRFRRVDLPNQPMIVARPDKVVDTTLATTLAEGQAKVGTTEHLLAALHALDIDNATIELSGDEVPAMDGSAADFVKMLEEAGRRRQNAARRYLRITRPIELIVKGRSIRVEPYDGCRISSRIVFEAPLIREQRYSLDLTPHDFSHQISSARTFGQAHEIEHLWQQNKAKGGSLDNSVVIHWDGTRVLNETGLRFDDEFVRHKTLDIIGDLALLGTPLLGHVIADKSGHALHYEFMQALMAAPDSWEYVEFAAVPPVTAPVRVNGKASRLRDFFVTADDECLSAPCAA